MSSSDAGMSSEIEYQVFLNFRESDIGAGFADFLYHSLINVGIRVFRDDEESRVGERTNGSLKQAIDNSTIYIPIFSQTYAASQRCLHELEQIVENDYRSNGSKRILPIYFDVEPNDVKLYTPLYDNAILNLKHEKELSDEQVQAWRKTLKEIALHKGRQVKRFRGQGELIKLVVEEVVEKLKTKYRFMTEHLVGIDDQALAVGKLLDINSNDVRFIKICGMGGIGKTTLATVVFNQLSCHFGECCYFLENIREKSSTTYGLLMLQEELLAEIMHPTEAKNIYDIAHGIEIIATILRRKKVLIILDDVDTSEQVEKLVGKCSFDAGSRIVITTRNKDVWQTQRSGYQVLDYEMGMISTDHALKLFSRHAFDRDSPSDDYNDLSRKIIATTGRLPLALEVIGSSLYNKNQDQWKRTLDNLRKAPHKDVSRKLKISYDALTDNQRQIFLDIACFFIDEDKTNAIYMWEDCGLFPNVDVHVLNSMCLIKIAENNKFWMHDQVRDLGREIVRQENRRNPKKCSRLWIYDEVINAVQTDEMKKNAQGLYLDTYPRSSHDVIIRSEEIGRFEYLRFLKLNGGTFVGDIANSLTKLRWISWNHPLKIYEWTNTCLNNVTILEFSDVGCLDDSRLQDLIKMKEKLKVLSLESCHKISRTPNFSGCPNLKRLTIERCSNLRKIDDSIGKLKCLINLKISECSYLENLPEEIGDIVNLEHLIVRWCKVTKLPNSIWELKLLREVHFDSAKLGLATMWELPSTIGMLQNLEVLIIGNYNLNGQLPSEIGSLPFLRTLILSHVGVNEVPETIRMLSCLQRLELIDCNRIQELPALLASLTHLRVSSTSLQIVPDLSNLSNLVELDLDDIGQGGDKSFGLWWIGRLSKLTKLSLRLQSVTAPPELASLPLLSQLDLFGFHLQTFQQLPLSLQKLGLDNFHSIVSPSLNLRNLSCLKLCGSQMREIQLNGLQLPYIRELLVDHCVLLRRFTLSYMRKMKEVHVRCCEKLARIQFSRVLESLEALYIDSCQSLRRLVNEGEAGHNNTKTANDLINSEQSLILPSSALIKLQSFTLIDCPKIHKIEVIGMSESWEHFDIQKCHYVQSLGDLSNLKNLKSFHMYKNNRLRVVKGLDKLEFLNSLQVRKCGSLERLINASSTKLPNHCYIHISGSGEKFRGSLESYKHPKEQERDFEEEQEQESDFEQQQESDLEEKQEQESDFELEQELKPGRRLGRVSFLLIIGVATSASALFLSKALRMKKTKIGASGR